MVLLLSLLLPPTSRKIKYDGLKLDMVKILQTQQFPSIFYFSQKAGCTPFRRLVTASLYCLDSREKTDHCHLPQNRAVEWPVQLAAHRPGLCVKATTWLRESLPAADCWAEPVPAGPTCWVCLSTEVINKHPGTGRDSQCKVNKWAIL